MRAGIKIEDGIVELTIASASQSEMQALNKLYRRDVHADNFGLSLNCFHRKSQQNDVSGVVFTSDHYITDRYLIYLGFERYSSTAGWKSFVCDDYDGLLLYRRKGSNVVIVYGDVSLYTVGRKDEIQFSPKIGSKGVTKLGNVTKLYELKQLLKPYKKIKNDKKIKNA